MTTVLPGGTTITRLFGAYCGGGGDARGAGGASSWGGIAGGGAAVYRGYGAYHPVGRGAYTAR